MGARSLLFIVALVCVVAAAQGLSCPTAEGEVCGGKYRGTCNNDTGSCICRYPLYFGPACDSSNASLVVTLEEQVSGIFPVSRTIVGNIILIVFYGVILAFGAKLISDGAELLLEVTNPVIIGGLVLPVLGAVPDSAIILVSGLGPDAQAQLSVGVGTLAGSTIFLLTLPWLFSVILGRCDLDANGQAIDQKCKGFSFTKQGVTVSKEVLMTSVIMLITMLNYFIIQGAVWHFGPKDFSVQPEYVRICALVTMVLCFAMLVAYCLFQLFSSRAAEKAKRLAAEMEEKRSKRAEELAIIAAYRLRSLMTASKNKNVNSTTPLMEGQKKSEGVSSAAMQGLAGRWKAKAGVGGLRKPEEEEKADKESEKSDAEAGEVSVEKKEMSKGKIIGKSAALLVVGLAVVSFFSDPMVDALDALTDPTNANFGGSFVPISSFYISFIITPLCSNASELISSLIFAMKKRKENISITYSQLYGAAIMNNTMCLGVFCALVYFKNLQWYYAAEVTVIIIVELIVGIVALVGSTYKVVMGVPVALLYAVAIALVAILDGPVGWR